MTAVTEHFYVMKMGEEFSSPFPQKAKKIFNRIELLKKKIEMRDNIFNLDIDNLEPIQNKLAESCMEDDEEKFNSAMESFFSWAKLNNIWVGKSIYSKITKMEYGNGYKIGK